MSHDTTFSCERLAFKIALKWTNVVMISRIVTLKSRNKSRNCSPSVDE